MIRNSKASGGTAAWLTALGLAALGLAACGDKPGADAKAGTPAEQAQAAAPVASQPAFAVPDTFQAAIGKVFDGYVVLQTALAQDDLAQAKEAFGSMHATLHMMPVDGLEPAAKAYWDSTDARIMDVLHPMASAESIDTVRTLFADFSEVMVDAISRFGMSGTGPAYQFHCPMARDNQGSDWLQKDKETANPYFGKSMLKCGNIVRTLEG